MYRASRLSCYTLRASPFFRSIFRSLPLSLGRLPLYCTSRRFELASNTTKRKVKSVRSAVSHFGQIKTKSKNKQCKQPYVLSRSQAENPSAATNANNNGDAEDRLSSHPNANATASRNANHVLPSASFSSSSSSPSASSSSTAISWLASQLQPPLPTRRSRPSSSSIQFATLREMVESTPFSQLSREQQALINRDTYFWSSCLRHWTDHKKWQIFYRLVPTIAEWLRSTATATTTPTSPSSSSSSLIDDLNSTAFSLVRGFIISTDLKKAIAWMDSLTSSSWNSPLSLPKKKAILLNQMMQQAEKLHDMPLVESLLDRARTQWKVVPDLTIYKSLFRALLTVNRSDPDSLVKVGRYMAQMEKDGIVPDVQTYNTFLDACVSRGEMDKATAVIAEMKKHNISPNCFTIGLLVRDYVRRGNMAKAREIFDSTRNMIHVDAPLISSLLNGYFKVGDFAAAEKLLHETRQSDRTSSIINERMVATIIYRYARAGQYDRSLALLKEMVQWGIPPTAHVFGEVIAGVSVHGDIDRASKMLDEMLSLRMRPPLAVFGMLVSTMVGQRQMVKAEHVFAQAKEAQAVDGRMYSSLIRGFINQKDLTKAFRYIDEMRQHHGDLRFASSLFLALMRNYGAVVRSHDPHLYQQCLSLYFKFKPRDFQSVVFLNDDEQQLANAMLEIVRKLPSSP